MLSRLAVRGPVVAQQLAKPAAAAPSALQKKDTSTSSKAEGAAAVMEKRPVSPFQVSFKVRSLQFYSTLER